MRLAYTLTGGDAALLQRTGRDPGRGNALPDPAGRQPHALIGDTVQKRLDALAKSLNRPERQGGYSGA